MTKPIRMGLLVSVLAHALLVAGLMALPFFPAAPPAQSGGVSLRLVMTAAPAVPTPTPQASSLPPVAAEPVAQTAAIARSATAAPSAAPASKPLEPAVATPAGRSQQQQVVVSAEPAPVVVDVAARDAYLQTLAERIRQQKHYPAAGRRLGQQGRVMIELVIHRDGQLAHADVTESSGFARLDDAALAAVRSAAPFSPLPLAFQGDALSLSVPMDFNLR